MTTEDRTGSEGNDAIEAADDTLQDEVKDKTRSQRQSRSGEKGGGKARSKTREEEEYLKWLNTAPTLYKRNLDAETIASVGYYGAFEPLDSPGRLNQTGDPVVVGEDGKEAILLRVVLVGGGDAEGKFLKRLSDQAAGKLVSGLYVLWDPRASELSDNFEDIPFLNVHELGSKNTKDPVKIAQHASFLGAHMVIVVGVQPGTGPDFPARVKTAALEEGVTFVGPGVAEEVVEGNLKTFTELVEGTRAAVAATWEANQLG